MFAIDIPTSVFVGFVFADAGRRIIESESAISPQGGENRVSKVLFLRVMVILFNVIFFTPVPLIFLNGWPGWQMNYVAPWADNLRDNPFRASVTAFFFAITIVPAFLSFELGRVIVLNKRPLMVKACAFVTACAIALIIYLTRDATFNIAATYADFHAGIVFPFTHPPFISLLAVTTVYSWGALIIFARWISKMK